MKVLQTPGESAVDESEFYVVASVSDSLEGHSFVVVFNRLSLIQWQ